MLNPENGPQNPSHPPASLSAPSPVQAGTQRHANQKRERQENDKITLFLFKDHHPPRSFELTLGWFNKTGTLLGALALLALISLAAALRVGWIARSSRPQALEQLREENRNLQTVTESLEKQIQTLQAQAQLAAEAPASTPSIEAREPAPPSVTPSNGIVSSENSESPAAPVEPSKSDSVPAPARLSWWAQAQKFWEKLKPSSTSSTSTTQALSQQGDSSQSSIPGSTLPTGFQPGAILGHQFLPSKSWPQPSAIKPLLKIALTPPQVTLKGNRLQVKFAIQYTADDGKNQQGRIILLARGPSGVLAYPEGVLNGMQTETLIAPDRGEFFSVGRYREVQNEFDLPGSRASSWKEVEILIFQPDESLLLRERIDITDSLRAPSPTPSERPKTRSTTPTQPKSEVPPSDPDSVISPGTDR